VNRVDGVILIDKLHCCITLGFWAKYISFKFLLVRCNCTLCEYETELVDLVKDKEGALSRIGKKWEICVVELLRSFLLSCLCGLYLNEKCVYIYLEVIGKK
jgi:hypothetical protein